MITLLLLLAIVGFLTWLIITYVPMPPPFKTAIIVVMVIILVIYVLRVLGVGDIPVPKL